MEEKAQPNPAQMLKNWENKLVLAHSQMADHHKVAARDP
jgi:hypothetical protein